jgi:ABC-2 type transport system permease protein
MSSIIKYCRIVAWSSYLQTLSFLRVKEAFFFAIIFPVFLFVLFGFIWGTPGSTEYVTFLLSGVVGMTIANDAIYGFGPIIKVYRERHLLKMLRTLPMKIELHFAGLFISRIAAMFLTIGLLYICSGLLFGYWPKLSEITLFLCGVFLGTVLFALFSLLITFLSKRNSESSMLSFLFFFMLFVSGAFYPMEEGTFLFYTAQLVPLTHLIIFIRGDWSYLPVLLVWIIVFGIVFFWLFRHKAIHR